MQLSPQTIELLAGQGLVEPFYHRHVHATGLSGGLSCAGYDVHIGEELKGLPVFNEQPEMHQGCWIIPPRTGCLGVTVEKFKLPPDICMLYFNKSTLARQFLNACATLGEPGWEGHLTLELYNQTDKPFLITPGQPIGQVIFNALDQDSAFPYTGKYQGQAAVPVEARRE
jgi:dCTP deaminase